MKKFTLFTICILTWACGQAQINPQGSSTCQLGYGFPSSMQLMSQVFKFSVNTDDPENTSEFRYKGFGPLHFRYENMVGGRIGIGLSANYEKGTFKFTDNYLDANDNQMSSVTQFDFSSFNAMARLNVHFIKMANVVDVYYGCGVGYAHTRVKLQETLGGNVIDPVEQQDIDDFNKYLNGIFKMMPVAFEEVVGLKAPLGPNAGIYFEVGYSKALAQVGFYAKLGEPRGFNSSHWKWY